MKQLPEKKKFMTKEKKWTPLPVPLCPLGLIWCQTRSALKAEQCLLFLLSTRQCLVNPTLSMIKLSFIECLLSSGAWLYVSFDSPDTMPTTATYSLCCTKEAWFGRAKELAQGHTASKWQNRNSTPAWDGPKAGLFPAFHAPLYSWIPPR